MFIRIRIIISLLFQGLIYYPSTYDQDYRLTARVVSGVFNHTYDYDGMNRIVEEVFGMTTTAWAYDSIGNRTSETVNSTPVTYTYPAGSSKLSSVGGNLLYLRCDGQRHRQGGAELRL